VVANQLSLSVVGLIVPSCAGLRNPAAENVIGLIRKTPLARWPAAFFSTCRARDQSVSLIVPPSLNGPTAVFGGATPEHTGLPYLSNRCDR
jgi:hypothetical protein